jgi:hypothetical protein
MVEYWNSIFQIKQRERREMFVAFIGGAVMEVHRTGI